MEKKVLPKSLTWIKKAFSRTIKFTDSDDQIIGGVEFKMFDSTVFAELNDTKLKFDIQGFINKEVTITNEKEVFLGHIHLKFRNKAEVVLANGEVYVWRKEDFFQHEWVLIHDLPNTDNDPVVVSYNRTRDFLTEYGAIKLEEHRNNEELLILTGFFIGFYFLRRRRKAAAAGA